MRRRRFSTNIAAMGGGGGGGTDAVHFDGATSLDIASLTCTDNAVASLSVWVNYGSTSILPAFGSSGANTVWEFFNGGGDPTNYTNSAFQVAGGGDVEIGQSDTTALAWTNILGTLDLGIGASWSTVNKDARVDLTNRNLTATGNDGSFTNFNGQAANSISGTQKEYFEITIDQTDSGNSPAVGFSNASVAFNTFLGIDGNSIALYSNGGVVFGGDVPFTIAGFTDGDVVGVAIDFANGKVWWRTNGGNWNNDAGADPATNTGGIALGVSGTVFPAYDLLNVAGVTANFGASAFAFTAPSGFTTLAVPGTGKLYVNDADVTAITANLSGFTFTCNGKAFSIGNSPDGAGVFFEGDMAYLWIAPGVDLRDGTGDIPVATRRLFITAGGKPADPTGWPAAAMKFFGDATTFGTNQGSGGAFTTTGTLTNASTSPSD